MVRLFGRREAEELAVLSLVSFRTDHSTMTFINVWMTGSLRVGLQEQDFIIGS